MQHLQGLRRMPLIVLSVSFLLGIGLASLSGAPVSDWARLGVTAGIAWLVVRRKGEFSSQPGEVPLISMGLLAVILLSIGAIRFQFSRSTLTPADLAWYNDQPDPVEVVGVIVRPPDVRDTHTQAVLAVELVTMADSGAVPVDGRLLAYLPAGEPWAYGDRVRLWGGLLTPPAEEDFSYRAYLARQGIHSYMPYGAASLVGQGEGNWFLARLYQFRQTGLALIYGYLPDPEASLLAGIVFGYESGIPEEVDQAFKDTGATHIIAISGFNITIVSGLFAMLFGRLLGPRRGAVAALAAITLYTVLVGGDAAVVRAAIMGGLSLFASQVGRRQHGLNSLAITAALMALVKPDILWDIGFQLSFAATLGLIIFAQPWEEWLQPG